MSDSMTMTSVNEPQPETGKPPFPNMVWIPGGTFLMGRISTIKKSRRPTR